MSDATTDFEKAIAQGAAKIAESEGAKRGRGRPRKNVTGADVVDAIAVGNPPPSGIFTGEGGVIAPPPPSYPPGTTSALWKIGSKLAARKTGYTGFECDTGEVEALDSASVPVLNRYLPPELVEASPLATMALTVAAVFGMKYLEYSDWRADQAKKANQPGDPAPIQ